MDALIYPKAPRSVVVATATLALVALILSVGWSPAVAGGIDQKQGSGNSQDAFAIWNGAPPDSDATAEQALLKLSRQKWQWMSQRDVDSLATLFHNQAVFVHMGATMSRQQELDVIAGGGIQYKTVDIQEASVRIIGSTAIVLSRIRLVAVVGCNEVVNSFVVTEVYVQQEEGWKLASLSFTRLSGQ